MRCCLCCLCWILFWIGRESYIPIHFISFPHIGGGLRRAAEELLLELLYRKLATDRPLVVLLLILLLLLLLLLLPALYELKELSTLRALFPRIMYRLFNVVMGVSVRSVLLTGDELLELLLLMLLLVLLLLLLFPEIIVF